MAVDDDGRGGATSPQPKLPPKGSDAVTRRNILELLLCLSAALATPQFASAENRACSHCGCTTHCRAVCRCVPSTEEKKETCFECKCEDFCVPGPSIFCGRKCEAMPLPESECGCPQNCCISWNVWKPRCAQVRTKRVLVVHEVKKEVPSHKWEVEYLCDECRQCCADAVPATTNAAGEIVPVSAEFPIDETTDATESPAAEPQGNWLTRLFAK
jgi:hypothetical protein